MIGRRLLTSNCHIQLRRRFFKLVENEEESFDFLIMRSYIRSYKALLAICKGILIVN
jgi:hypothetical protein